MTDYYKKYLKYKKKYLNYKSKYLIKGGKSSYIFSQTRDSNNKYICAIIRAMILDYWHDNPLNSGTSRSRTYYMSISGKTVEGIKSIKEKESVKTALENAQPKGGGTHDNKKQKFFMGLSSHDDTKIIFKLMAATWAKHFNLGVGDVAGGGGVFYAFDQANCQPVTIGKCKGLSSDKYLGDGFGPITYDGELKKKIPNIDNFVKILNTALAISFFKRYGFLDVCQNDPLDPAYNQLYHFIWAHREEQTIYFWSYCINSEIPAYWQETAAQLVPVFESVKNLLEISNFNAKKWLETTGYIAFKNEDTSSCSTISNLFNIFLSVYRTERGNIPSPDLLEFIVGVAQNSTEDILNQEIAKYNEKPQNSLNSDQILQYGGALHGLVDFLRTETSNYILQNGFKEVGSKLKYVNTYFNRQDLSNIILFSLFCMNFKFAKPPENEIPTDFHPSVLKIIQTMRAYIFYHLYNNTPGDENAKMEEFLEIISKKGIEYYNKVSYIISEFIIICVENNNNQIQEEEFAEMLENLRQFELKNCRDEIEQGINEYFIRKVEEVARGAAAEVEEAKRFLVEKFKHFFGIEYINEDVFNLFEIIDSTSIKFSNLNFNYLYFAEEFFAMPFLKRNDEDYSFNFLNTYAATHPDLILDIQNFAAESLTFYFLNFFNQLGNISYTLYKLPQPENQDSEPNRPYQIGVFERILLHSYNEANAMLNLIDDKYPELEKLLSNYFFIHIKLFLNTDDETIRIISNYFSKEYKVHLENELSEKKDDQKKIEYVYDFNHVYVKLYFHSKFYGPMPPHMGPPLPPMAPPLPPIAQRPQTAPVANIQEDEEEERRERWKDWKRGVDYKAARKNREKTWVTHSKSTRDDSLQKKRKDAPRGKVIVLSTADAVVDVPVVEEFEEYIKTKTDRNTIKTGIDAMREKEKSYFETKLTKGDIDKLNAMIPKQDDLVIHLEGLFRPWFQESCILDINEEDFTRLLRQKYEDALITIGGMKAEKMLMRGENFISDGNFKDAINTLSNNFKLHNQEVGSRLLTQLGFKLPKIEPTFLKTLNPWRRVKDNQSIFIPSINKYFAHFHLAYIKKMSKTLADVATDAAAAVAAPAAAAAVAPVVDVLRASDPADFATAATAATAIVDAVRASNPAAVAAPAAAAAVAAYTITSAGINPAIAAAVVSVNLDPVIWCSAVAAAALAAVADIDDNNVAQEYYIKRFITDFPSFITEFPSKDSVASFLYKETYFDKFKNLVDNLKTDDGAAFPRPFPGDGWFQAFDPKSDNWYYFNPVTKERMDGLVGFAQADTIMCILYLFDFKYKCVDGPRGDVQGVRSVATAIAGLLDTHLKEDPPSLKKVKDFLFKAYIQPVQQFLEYLKLLYNQEVPLHIDPFGPYLGYFIIMYFSDNFNFEGKKRNKKQYIHPDNNPYLQIFQLYHNMEDANNGYNAFITLLEGLYDNFITVGISSHELESLFWCKYMLYVRNAKNFYYTELYGPVTNINPYFNWDLKKLNNKKSDNDDELVKLKTNLFKIIQAAHPCSIQPDMYMSIPNSVYNAVEEKLRMIAKNKCSKPATDTADCGGDSNVASEVEKAATELIQPYMFKAFIYTRREEASEIYRWIVEWAKTTGTNENLKDLVKAEQVQLTDNPYEDMRKKLTTLFEMLQTLVEWWPELKQGVEGVDVTYINVLKQKITEDIGVEMRAQEDKALSFIENITDLKNKMGKESPFSKELVKQLEHHRNLAQSKGDPNSAEHDLELDHELYADEMEELKELLDEIDTYIDQKHGYIRRYLGFRIIAQRLLDYNNLPYSSFHTFLQEYQDIVQTPEFRERIWSDITKSNIRMAVNNITTLIKDDICDLLTWAMEIVHKQSDIVSDLPSVKSDFGDYIMSRYYDIRIDIRQFPKIIKIDFPQIQTVEELTGLIQNVFDGWYKLSFQKLKVSDYNGLKTTIILWIQWMNNPRKPAPKFESADIPFYISIKKKPSEQRYIISFTNTIFEIVSNLNSLQSKDDAFNMIEEEINSLLKSRLTDPQILQIINSGVQYPFVILGKNIKSTANKFPGQIEPLTSLVGSNKFYIRAQSTLPSPGPGDSKLPHNYYYWTIAGNGKDYKCATFSKYWKDMLLYFETSDGSGGLKTNNPMTDIRIEGDFFAYSNTLLEIINYHKFSGDQLQRLICIAYSFLNFEDGQVRNIYIDKQGLLVGSIGSIWFTQDKSTTFGAFIEVASCLRNYVSKYKAALADEAQKVEISKNLLKYLKCLPIIIKPICFNHPIGTEDKCKEDPTKYLYPYTFEGGINHSSDQGKDVKDFHKTFADQWEAMHDAKTAYIKAEDNETYYTGNLAFDFGQLVPDEDGAFDREKMITKCKNFCSKVFSSDFNFLEM